MPRWEIRVTSEGSEYRLSLFRGSVHMRVRFEDDSHIHAHLHVTPEFWLFSSLKLFGYGKKKETYPTEAMAVEHPTNAVTE